MKTIVFARYNEDSSVILNALYNTDAKIYVYDRGKEPIDLPADDRLVHVRDENTSREDGAYVRYILDHYDDLEGTIIFSQSRLEDHAAIWRVDGDFLDWINGIKDLHNYKPYIMDMSINGREVSQCNHVYSLLFNESPPSHICFYSCAIFATNADAIKKNSIDFYKNIRDLQKIPENSIWSDAHVDNVRVWLNFPWMMERLWGYIFDKENFTSYPEKYGHG